MSETDIFDIDMSVSDKPTSSVDRFDSIVPVRELGTIKAIFNVLDGADVFICGGFARYACSPVKEPIRSGDIDIYSKTEADFDKAKELFRINNFSLVSETLAAANFRDDRIFTFNKIEAPIQLIKPVKQGDLVLTGSVEEIVSNFDFSISRVAIIDPKNAIVDPDFLEDETNKKLNIKHIHCPISSVFRIMKYNKKGYFIRIPEILKIFEDWIARDEKYKSLILDVVRNENPSEEEIQHLEKLLHID
jgi:hypothetical protein